MHICIDRRIYIYTHVNTHTYIYIHTHICICTYRVIWWGHLSKVSVADWRRCWRAMPRFPRSSTKFGSAPRWDLGIWGPVGWVWLVVFVLYICDDGEQISHHSCHDKDDIVVERDEHWVCMSCMIYGVIKNMKLVEILSKSGWLLGLSDTATHVMRILASW